MKKPKNTKRNKLFLSLGLIVVSGMYALSQYAGNAAAPAASHVAVSSVARSAPVSQKKAASGLYADGTYVGSAADAYYGTVQVKAVVQGGKLASVQFLQHPSGRSTSVAINSQAMPALTSEAIQAQTSSVNIVSGATFTSQAFQQSLHSALLQAQA